MIATNSLLAEESSLIPAGAKVEKVTGDLKFSEGPAWHPEGFLIFEDIPRNRILKLDANDKVTVFREPSGHSNGLTFDREGRLLAAEGNSADGGRRISRTEKDGRVVSLADKFNGKRLNSPNDLAVDAKGRVYFTDPRYGARDGVEQDKESVYRIDPDGKLTRIIDSVSKPNGIAVSIDQKTLFVADNDPTAKRVLLAFDLAADGSASRPRVLHDFGTGRGIDGMTLDSTGRIWATAGSKEKAGVHVFEISADRNYAKLLTVVSTPEDPTNCTFGGADRNVLYITTASSLFRIRTAAKGVTSLPGK
ncbi:MAG: SMP-30/gluconolactonase/LRE family protein [Planctomycetales bacterium]|nr:SMP-30/gluconolactonase/LRE family protein [Planctomycetales bacterium]